MMELATALTNLKSAQLTSEIQIRVARKMMDSQEQVGASVLKLLNAASPAVAQAGDALTAAATGLGSQIDVYG